MNKLVLRAQQLSAAKYQALPSENEFQCETLREEH